MLDSIFVVCSRLHMCTLDYMHPIYAVVENSNSILH